jgi:YjbE family integral membrane protein
MELFSLEFAAALAAIVVIDLVLAGDNAIVIALAARNLPRHLQRRAMIWGAAGAVIVRSLLTLIVVWLLQFPGLLLIGGVMLIWIAYQLLLPEQGNGDAATINSASTFWGAIRTIVVADIVMGLDNVLAVAGAAHGSFLLVALGLLISVPILIWGSSMLLGLVERFPGLVYLGAGVLALTAAKMISAEPFLKDSLAAYRFIVPLLYVVTVFGVLWAGFVRNHRRLESRIRARLASFPQRHGNQQSIANPTRGENAMLKVLVPVDGSRNSHFAARHIVKQYRLNNQMEIHLLNVQSPFSRHVAAFVSRKNRDAYHREEAIMALHSVRQILDREGVPYTVHVETGDKAKLIADAARRLDCDHIVMSTARKSSLTRMIENSITNRVLELTSVPVEVIAGDAVSRAERFGIPAGIGVLAAFLLLAAAD